MNYWATISLFIKWPYVDLLSSASRLGDSWYFVHAFGEYTPDVIVGLCLYRIDGDFAFCLAAASYCIYNCTGLELGAAGFGALVSVVQWQESSISGGVV